MAALDLLREAGGWLGTVGSGVAVEIYRRFRSTEKVAQEALATAQRALETARELKKAITSLRSGVQLDVGAFKLDIEGRVHDLERRLDNFFRQSRPDIPLSPTDVEVRRVTTELQRLFDEKLEKLRAEVISERGQRHALAKAFTDYMNKAESSWQSIQRDIGRIEGAMQERDR